MRGITRGNNPWNAIGISLTDLNAARLANGSATSSKLLFWECEADMTKHTYRPIGSISHGTMLASDLIPAFASELEYAIAHSEEYENSFDYARKLIRESEAIDFNAEDNDQDEIDGVLEELFDALGNFALPYFYFGAHPGDGCDYGFWLSDDFESDFDGLKVNDTSEVPADYSGEVLHVNDHGNCTLYVASKGELTEVWGLA